MKALHNNGSTTKSLVDFDALKPDNVKVLYKYFSGNSSFFGVGGGRTSDGGRIEVQESVGPNLVAPLEIFYDAQVILHTCVMNCFDDLVIPRH